LAGNDQVYGGSGTDVLLGGEGADALYGEGGDDTIQADGIVKAGYLNSVNAASYGADFADGGAGNGGNDTLYGGKLFGDTGVKSDSEHFVDLPFHCDDYLDTASLSRPNARFQDSSHLKFTMESIAACARVQRVRGRLDTQKKTCGRLEHTRLCNAQASGNPETIHYSVT